MFGWIEHIFSNAGSAIADAVKSLVHTLIRGLYSFLHDIFRAQWDAWNAFWNGVTSLYRGTYDFALSTFRKFAHLYRVIIKGLNDYIKWVYNTVVHLAYVLYKQISDALAHAYHDLLSRLDALRKWAIANIWDPLFKSLTTAWHWLTHEGATMWHYFTHLTEFAEVLFWHIVQSLEKHAWDAAKLLGEFFLSLVVHNIVRFATLMENVIDAVL